MRFEQVFHLPSLAHVCRRFSTSRGLPADRSRADEPD
jgi:hypothetical protein